MRTLGNMSANTTAETGPTVGHDFATFEEFWPYYVAMHSQPTTRMVHLAGTVAAGTMALTALFRLRPKVRRLLMVPLVGYGTAWATHWFIERNNPATIGYPAWSLQGDLEMVKTMLAGRDDELTQIARGWLAEHPEDRSPGSIEPA